MEPAQPAARMRKPRLPSGRAWLCVLVPYEAATYGSQLAHLMDDPAMIALLAASPAFARMLRPLFWATGAHPTAGRLPPLAPRKPRAPRPRRPRQKKVYWKCAKPPASGLIFYTK
jgi:hypothetical protein